MKTPKLKERWLNKNSKFVMIPHWFFAKQDSLMYGIQEEFLKLNPSMDIKAITVAQLFDCYVLANYITKREFVTSKNLSIFISHNKDIIDKMNFNVPRLRAAIKKADVKAIPTYKSVDNVDNYWIRLLYSLYSSQDTIADFVVLGFTCTYEVNGLTIRMVRDQFFRCFVDIKNITWGQLKKAIEKTADTRQTLVTGFSEEDNKKGDKR